MAGSVAMLLIAMACEKRMMFNPFSLLMTPLFLWSCPFMVSPTEE